MFIACKFIYRTDYLGNKGTIDTILIYVNVNKFLFDRILTVFIVFSTAN